MTAKTTHYPSYDVMALKDEWDSHTKEIVLKRQGPFPKAKFLKKHESMMLALIAQHIVYDNRSEILAWVLHHIDQKLQNKIGEAQRKPGTSPEKVLVRQGLKAMDKLSKQKNDKLFADLGMQEQFELLAAMQLGQAEQIPEWSKIPQKDLFKKLSELIVGAYYSHPTVWSEIGYGGPAYPRGYVRVEFGLADPWEAKQEDASRSGFAEDSPKREAKATAGEDK